jgi:hypothetical protein
MILKARKGYQALALALLVFTTSIASSGYKIHLEYGRITKKFLPSLWTAAQAEIELLRLLDALNRYVYEDAPSNSAQLVERFYILQSRIPLLLTGSESVHVRAAEGTVQIIQEFDQTLAALERNVLSLRKGDYASYFYIHAALQQYTTPMHKITARTMLKDEEVAEAQREDIRHLYWELSGYFVAIIARRSALPVLGRKATSCASSAAPSGTRARLTGRRLVLARCSYARMPSAAISGNRRSRPNAADRAQPLAARPAPRAAGPRA